MKFQNKAHLLPALSFVWSVSLVVVPSGFAAKTLSAKFTSDLNFGQVVQGDSPLTVTASPSNSNSAILEVRGEANSAYTIVLPSGSVLLKNGSAALFITDFRSAPDAGPNGKLDSAGKQQVALGATLQSIPVHQPRGKYRGSFVVTVIY